MKIDHVKAMKAATASSIPKEDLALIKKDKSKGLGGFLTTKLFPALKEAGSNWAEKNRLENERQRKAMEKK